MKVIIRTDASVDIGTGHVMRCLTLADKLKKKNIDVVFVCRDLEGNLFGLIKDKGFKCKLLARPQSKVKVNKTGPSHEKWLGVSWQDDVQDTLDALGEDKSEWIVVDHYGLDSQWHNKIRKKINKIFVIDDLADRALDCDILLDQNFYLNPESRYEKVLPINCKSLLGPKYSLLRDEFINDAKIMDCSERHQISRLLVFMGGADYTNETEKTLKAFERITDMKFEVDVVVSSVNKKANHIKKLCKQNISFHFHQDIDYMSELMQKADVAIGAGGATVIERCYVGLPSLVILVAENQKETTMALENEGVLFCLGWHEDVNEMDIVNGLYKLINNAHLLKEMCENSKIVIGDKGYVGVDGVVNIMLNKNEKI